MFSAPPAAPVRNVYSPNARTGVGTVVRDLVDGFLRFPLWTAFAWNDIQKRYRRSMLGLAWIVISYYIFVAAIAVFFGGFSARSGTDYTAYVATGYAALTFLMANISDGCTVFNSAATWIKSTPLPYSTHIYKSISRSLFVFGVQMASALVIMPFLNWHPNAEIWKVIPALALFLVNALWLQVFFGMIATRWRDVAHLFNAVTRILFFTTPILWVYDERTGIRKTLAGFNPFTHFLEIFRGSILGEPASMGSWLTVLAWTVGGCVMALITASRMQRRLPFWV
ncbi:ABC transporter permease [Hyphococcus sp.]|uniref:ABC transporter permease n=1 Tax=Hyphococcus sp. TaxID=2038636 RepID=UPI0035C74826